MNRSGVPFAAAVAGCLAVVALWVSGQSFWIDECNAAVKAIQPDLRSFWTKFSGMRGSDFQMPLYMFLLWCWEKVVGPGEFALRALNILFAWSAILLVVFRSSLSRRFRLFWCLAAAVSPMLAVYMDEARPYALQFAAATFLFLPEFEDAGGDSVLDFGFRTFSVGLLLLCGSSLTGVVFAFWPCVWLLVRTVRQRAVARFLAHNRVWIAVDAAVLAVLGTFYLHTLLSGARASSVGSTTATSTAFCFYEFFGFMGVGPSRLALRASQVGALEGFLFPLALYAAAFVPFAVFVCREAVSAGRDERLAWRSGLPVCLAGLGVLSMILVGVATEMRVLARHLMPALPVFLCLTAELFSATFGRVRGARPTVVLVLLAFFASSLSFRLRSDHAKDDYRRAAAVASRALFEGKTVWWAADTAALEYYGLPTHSGALLALANPSPKSLSAEPCPDVLLLSKPDVYDRQGALRDWLSGKLFVEAGSFPAFAVLEKCADLE